jgi:hypothetical protein
MQKKADKVSRETRKIVVLKISLDYDECKPCYFCLLNIN